MWYRKESCQYHDHGPNRTLPEWQQMAHLEDPHHMQGFSGLTAREQLQEYSYFIVMQYGFPRFLVNTAAEDKNPGTNKHNLRVLCNFQ